MLKEIRSRSFANGIVYALHTEDGYPLEVTDTFLPNYTKDAINDNENTLKTYELGDRSNRWMIGVSCMSGCPVGCKFCLEENTLILMSDFTKYAAIFLYGVYPTNSTLHGFSCFIFLNFLMTMLICQRRYLYFEACRLFSGNTIPSGDS